MAGIHFWDASALIPLVFEEPHTRHSLGAREQGARFMAWEWVVIEAHATLFRRKAQARHFSLLKTILDPFEFFLLSSGSENHPALIKLLEKHHLRSADAGHLFCLKQAQELFPEIEFVCFDDELTRAAKREGIRVFGKH